jgi:urea transporter/murein DD-endopeptidase MepM/ murein hydrolase activator NlpD
MIGSMKTFLERYSEILFMSDYRYGLVLLLGTFIFPNVGIAGLIAVFSAFLFARVTGMDPQFVTPGAPVYNPLLTGLAIGYFYTLNAPVVFLTVLAGIATFLLTLALAGMFRYYFRLPVLSAPFVVAGIAVYLAGLRYPALYSPPYLPAPFAVFASDFSLPLWAAGFFKSCGMILFTPSVLAGLLFILVILCYSRILFILALGGWFTGTLVGMWLTGSGSVLFADVYAFNFIIVAMAVGGVFLIPSRRSYLLALVSVMLSAVVLDSWYAFTYGMIPALALPFNVVVLVVLYVLVWINYPVLSPENGGTPEERLENYITTTLRFPSAGVPRICLPFSGTWTVWQGPAGEWTHKGGLANAYDFVVRDEQGSTFSGNGSRLEDYYAYRKPVLSPVRGKVVETAAGLPDCPPGVPDSTSVWGNYVIIGDDRGFFVKISHLAANSVRVSEGARVERGMILGLCGNSGYSPQPHVHIQCQKAGHGNETVPFTFSGYIENKRYHARGSPAENSPVEPLYPDKSLEHSLNFLLDDTFSYEVLENGARIAEFDLKVRMADDGIFYLDSGKGKLYFGRDNGTFSFYRVEGEDRYLNMIFSALPSIPLSCREDMAWTDFLPARTVTGGIRKIVSDVCSSFYHPVARVQSELRFTGRTRVSSVIGSRALGICKTATVVFGSGRGIQSVETGTIKISMKEPAPASPAGSSPEGGKRP